MTTAFTLVTDNELWSTNFNEAAAKETLKLIGQELMVSYPDVFDVIPKEWAHKVYVREIVAANRNVPQHNR